MVSSESDEEFSVGLSKGEWVPPCSTLNRGRFYPEKHRGTLRVKEVPTQHNSNLKPGAKFTSQSPGSRTGRQPIFSVNSTVWHLRTRSIRKITSTSDPDTFEKYRDTPPISIAILLQKYALFLAESSIYTTNVYHDTPPICIAMLLQEYKGQGSLEHSQFMKRYCCIWSLQDHRHS